MKLFGGCVYRGFLRFLVDEIMVLFLKDIQSWCKCEWPFFEGVILDLFLFYQSYPIQYCNNLYVVGQSIIKHLKSFFLSRYYFSL